MSIRIGVIGAGRMGSLHCRVLSDMRGIELAWVMDTDPAAARAAAEKYHSITVDSIEQAVGLIDAVVVATSTSAHARAARPFIAAGKAVLIEKPIADNVAAAEGLIALAHETGASVQVGHTERFNPAVEAIRRFAITPKFIEAHRISPFTFRSADIGVVLDMMIHDIDLVLMMVGEEPTEVQAVGVNVIGAAEDIANARLTFANGCVANLTASRMAIKSQRQMRIFAEQAYLSVDYGRKVGIVVKKSDNLDLIQMARQMDVKNLSELAGKVDYTKLLKIEQLKISDVVEPLRKQAEAFRQCVAENAEPVVSAEAGLAAVRCAQAITDSIMSHKWDGKASERTGLGIVQKDG